MINNQHQPRIVVRVQFMTPECDSVFLEICKDLEYLSGAEVLDEGNNEDMILKRPIKWKIARLGNAFFSCISFVASRDEIRKVLGLDGERLLSPDEAEKELRLEARVPPVVSESMGHFLDGLPMPFFVLGLLSGAFEEARENRVGERWSMSKLKKQAGFCQQRSGLNDDQ